MGFLFQQNCPFCWWEGTPQLTKADASQELYYHLDESPECAEAFDADPEPLYYKDR